MTENCLRTSTKAKIDFQVEITTNSFTDLGFFSTSNAYEKGMISCLFTMVEVILIENRSGIMLKTQLQAMAGSSIVCH